MPGKVNVIRPNGEVIGVDEDKLADYESLGYRVEQPEETALRLSADAEKAYYDTTENAILATVEGGLSSATFGAADLFMDDRDTRKRAQYNQGARALGEFGGAALTSVFSGGAGLAGKLARATPSGALTHSSVRAAEGMFGTGLKSRIAGGVMEGTLAGVGGEVTRATLASDPLTVEGVMAGGLFGGMFGGGFGALGSGLEYLGKGADSRLANEAAESIPVSKSLEDEFLERYMGPVPEHPLGNVFEGYRAPQVRPEPSAMSVGEAVAEGLVPDTHYQAFRSSVKELRSLGDRLVNEVDEGHALLKAQLSKLNEAGDGLYKKGLAVSNSAVRGSKMKFDPATGYEEVAGKGKFQARDAFDKVSRGELLAEVRRARDAANKAMNSATPAKTGELLERYRASILKLAEMTGGEVPEALTKQVISRVEDVTEFNQALRGLSAPGGLPIDADALFRMTPDSAEETFARLSYVLKFGIPEAKPIQDGLAKSLDDLLATSGLAGEGNQVDRLRQLWAAGREARTKASEGWLEDVWRNDYVDAGLKGVDLNKVTPPEPKIEVEAKKAKADKPRMNEVAAAVKRAALNAAARGAMGAKAGTVMPSAVATVIGMLLSGKAAVSHTINKAVSKLGRSGKPIARIGTRLHPLYRTIDGLEDPDENVKEAFKKRSKEIREATVSGKDRAFLAAQELTVIGQGDFAKAAYQHHGKAITALATAMPKLPEGVRWGDQQQWEWPEEQLVVFGQQYEAVTSPLSFIERVTDNPSEVFPEAIKLLADVWPSVFAQFQLEVISTLDPGQMSYGDLAAWSTVLQMPLVPTMRPEFIAAQAAMFAQPPPETNQPAPKGMAGRPGGGPNGQDATPAQRTMLR